MALRYTQPGTSMGSWTSPLKAAARGVAAGARGVAHGAEAAGRTVKHGAGAFSPPWAGTRIGTKGWVTRLGERLSTMGIPVVGVACSTKKYRDSGFCRTAGRISWQVGKRAVEKAYGLPDGSLDQAEGILNQAGKDDPRLRKLPPDVRQLLIAQREAPTWWEQILDAVGLR